MTKYTLPDLPYDFGALEPHISGKILELHHDKHHKAYVAGANAALDRLNDMREKKNFDDIAAVERALAFNVSGHVMHSIYWQNMKKGGGGEPTGDLAKAISTDFRDFATFKAQLTKAAATVMGSGWAALVWDPLRKCLATTQIYDHQSNVTQAGIPLLVIDAWEHAWYLQYQSDKVKYFEAIWNVFNWDDVAARYASAKGFDIKLNKVAE